MNIPAELGFLLRRVRLEAAVALAEQQRAPDVEQTRLAAELRHVVSATLAQHGGERFARLLDRLALSELDALALAAAVALELDPVFDITVAALAGTEPRLGLSARLVAIILRLTGDAATALQISDAHPLVRTGVLELTSEAPRALATWRVSARTLSHLCGGDELDPALRRSGSVLAAPAGANFEFGETARALLDRVIADGETVVVCIEGPDGVGRRSVAATVAATHGKTIVALDASRASTDPLRLRAELRALAHECWLRDAIPLVARVDVLEARVAELVVLRDGGRQGPTLLTAASGTTLPELDVRVIRTHVDLPPANARAEIWTAALGGAAHVPPELREIVHAYTLTPGSIGRAAANATMIARGRAVGSADIRAGVAAEVQERFGELARRVQVTQTWSDLVLPDDTLDDIKAFVSRAAKTAIVYDQWGFRGKLQRGLGLAALFSGPPGTGKTMVAGLIAKSLELDLYQVDLSQVVSKWVGETEKQLSRIFDAAAMGHALLLFDEADALFAKRTEVKSSNDRYANLEVNYLLQRIEAFDGVAILTTNLDASVDPAFKRRLAIEIPFYAPEVAERERLWKAMLPAAAPRAADLDFAALAQMFDDLCGGNIRNSVLRGAFLAASEGKPIAQDHLVRAARSEYRAMGKVGG